MAKQTRALSKKQRLFLKYYSETGFADGKGAECVKRAGYSPKNAAQTACQLKRSPIIKTAMQEALDNEGLTIKAMAKEATRLALNSMHPFAPTSPDNEVRRRTIEMAGKMHDVFPSTKIDINKVEARYNMTAGDLKKLDDYKAGQIIDAEIIEEDGVESF